MKATTVGLLAVAAMGMVGIAVWKATAPDPASEGQGGAGPIEPIVVEKRDAKTEPAGSQVFDEWHFQTGKAVVTEGRLGHPSLYVDQDNETYLYLSVRAAADAVARKAAPLNIAIVIDRSGSMAGKRIQNAIAAARGMVGRLRDGDAVSVITYNTATELLVPVTNVSESTRQDVLDKIENIAPVGDTCISCAIDAAADVVGRRSGMVNRILLLSDGQATAGVREVEGFRRIAQGVQRRGCSISTIGVDVQYNERIMTALAVESNGMHYFVDKPAELSSVFDRELKSLVRTIARNADVHVDLAPGVDVAEVYGRAHRKDGNRLIVPLGDFAAGDRRSVLVRVSVERGPVGRRPIADVRLVYDDLSGDEDSDCCSGKLLVWMTADRSQASELDPLVAGRLSRANTTAALREANTLFDSGKYQEANAKLDATRTKVRDDRTALEASAPADRRSELAEDFDHQVAALDDAHEGFSQRAREAAQAKPGRPPAKPNQTRAGKAQVRANAYEYRAMDL